MARARERGGALHVQRFQGVLGNVVAIRLAADLFHDQPGDAVVDVAVFEAAANRMGERNVRERANLFLEASGTAPKVVAVLFATNRWCD
jgi:hypothetical protein